MTNRFALVLILSALACGGDEPGSITGAVSGPAGPIANAEVSGSGKTATSSATGAYQLSDIPAGDVEVTASLDWYADRAETVTVRAGEATTQDFTMAAAPLRVEAADLALATTFNATADWTLDSVSIAHVAAPTRALLELAIHYRNPALYRDPSSEAQVTPSTLPSVAVPSSFDFEVTAGVQALDVATVVDAISVTPSDGVALWEPMLSYLLDEWSFDDVTPLYTAGVAVRSQKWEGTGTLPAQQVERVYLEGGDIWVEVVFQDFVDLAADINDTDGDGLREIWAKVNPAHFDAALYAELRDVYVAEHHGTLEMKEILDENLDELYSRGTNANVINAIGQPYTHDDLGTVEYPFAVVFHGTIAVANVFLVEP